MPIPSVRAFQYGCTPSNQVGVKVVVSGGSFFLSGSAFQILCKWLSVYIILVDPLGLEPRTNGL